MSDQKSLVLLHMFGILKGSWMNVDSSEVSVNCYAEGTECCLYLFEAKVVWKCQLKGYLYLPQYAKTLWLVLKVGLIISLMEMY